MIQDTTTYEKLNLVCKLQLHGCTLIRRLTRHHCIPVSVFRYPQDIGKQKKISICRSCHGKLHSAIKNEDLRYYTLKGVYPGTSSFDRVFSDSKRVMYKRGLNGEKIIIDVDGYTDLYAMGVLT